MSEHTTFTMPFDPKVVGRTCKALARVYRFSTGTMSLGDYLSSVSLVRRSHYIRHYARHKRRGCYAKLATPAHEYSVWWLDGDGHETGIGVPKIVYDALPDVPATENEEYHD